MTICVISRAMMDVEDDVLTEEKIRSRRSVRREIEIDAPARRVWKIFSSPENLLKTHPYIKENVAITWDGVGSMDRLTYNNGHRLRRVVRNWEEGVGYDLDVAYRPHQVSRVEWRVRSLGENQCLFSIEIFPFHLDQAKGFKKWLRHRLVISPMLGSYLDAVVQGYKHYAETNEPVSPDQFGFHPYFSAPKSPGEIN